MEELMQLSGASSVATVVLLFGLVAYKFLKHSRCRSRCLGGKETSVKVDLGQPSTPTEVTSSGFFYQLDNK